MVGGNEASIAVGRDKETTLNGQKDEGVYMTAEQHAEALKLAKGKINVHRACAARPREELRCDECRVAAAYIDLHERMEKIEKEITKAKHSASCPHFLPSGWRWETRKRDREPCNCFKYRILALTKGKK